MGELHERNIQIAVQKIGERLAGGPRTLNELRDWFVKELGGDLGAFQDACKYTIRMGVVEARNLGKTKMLALAGQHHATRSKGSGYVQDPTVRDPEKGDGESLSERALRLERAADRPVTAARVATAKLGRMSHAGYDFPKHPGPAVVDHPEPLKVPAAAAPPPPSSRVPSEPRPLADAPSRALAVKPTLNVGPPAGSNDKPALSTPPAPADATPERDPGQARGSSPAASTQSLEWIEAAEVAAMLGIKPSSVTTTLRRYDNNAVRTERQPGRGGRYRFVKADVIKLGQARDGARTAKAPAAEEDPTVRLLREAKTLGVVLPSMDRLAESFSGEGPPLTVDETAALVAADARPSMTPAVGREDLPATPTVGLSRRERSGIALTLIIKPEPMALLVELAQTGLYAPTAREIAEEMLLAELRRHVAMPGMIAKARR